MSAGIESRIAAPAHRGPGELTRPQLKAILSGLLMASLLGALDQTVVVTAMRTIADDLHGLSAQAWVTTGYLITSTVTIPLYGKFGDLYGRRRVLLTAMAIFIGGSALCGLAGSMYELAAARGVQGVGAGGLVSIVVAVIGDVVPAREVSRYQAYFMPVYALASLLGPVVGGFFAGHNQLLGVAGWRWAFLVNLPVGLAALAIVARVLRIPHTVRRHRVDWLGVATLLAGAVPLLVVLAQGRDWGWGSAAVLVTAAVGVLGLIGFVAVQRRMGADALLPTALLRIRSFALGTAVSVVVGAAMLGMLVTLPLYLQIVKGSSPTQTGLLLMSLTAALMAGSVLCGQFIARTGRYKIVPVTGSLLMAAGLALLQAIGADTALWQTGADMAVFGFGLGMCMQPLTLVVQTALSEHDTGLATSSALFARQIGGTLGTAVFLSVLFATVRDRIGDALHSMASAPQLLAAMHDPAVRADPANRPVLQAIADGSAQHIPLDDSAFIGTLDPRLARPVQIGYAESMSWVFLIGCAIVLAGFVMLLFLRERPLSTQSALAARQAAQSTAKGPVVVHEQR